MNSPILMGSAELPDNANAIKTRAGNSFLSNDFIISQELHKKN